MDTGDWSHINSVICFLLLCNFSNEELLHEVCFEFSLYRYFVLDFSSFFGHFFK